MTGCLLSINNFEKSIGKFLIIRTVSVFCTDGYHVRKRDYRAVCYYSRHNNIIYFTPCIRQRGHRSTVMPLVYVASSRLYLNTTNNYDTDSDDKEVVFFFLNSRGFYFSLRRGGLECRDCLFLAGLYTLGVIVFHINLSSV